MKQKNIRLVVVTGAGSGIGQATALRFARGGATAVCLDINEASATETADQIKAAGGQAFGYALDVSDAAQFSVIARMVQEHHGVPDVVVNNAGILKVGGTMTHSMEVWDQVIGVDLSGVVYGCQLFGAQMVERGQGGHIVNISSMAAFAPTVSFSSYTVAKAGVRMLSECLHAELRSDGIGVSAICPGGIHTNIWRTADFLAVDQAESERRLDAFGGVVELARKLRVGSQPDDVARAIVKAVEHDRVIVPVRPESWFLYAMSRLSPDLVLLGARLTRDDMVERFSSVITRRATPSRNAESAATI
jgi:NAD(P)-dependent dehydrogenase (short-subunit alcohol dehydrogenase family)